jgi:predicted O-methyltransferase YrrM
MPDLSDAAEVDAFIIETLLGWDPTLDAALRANRAARLPPMDVSPPQGRLLQLLAQMVGARNILEVGTLGGYSTICLARALPADGRLVTLEINPHHAEVARTNIALAGLADRVDLRVGRAGESLTALAQEGREPFDLSFIDADKESNPEYFRAAVALSRPGSVIVIDNVIRGGRVVDADSRDPAIQGTRALYEAVAADPWVSATVIQTVGAKGWDGFLVALVGEN